MADIDTSKIKVVEAYEDAENLRRQGWRQVHYTELPLYFLMAPPEPTLATLAERLDGVIDEADQHDIDCGPIFDAKAELRRLTKIEAVAQAIIDETADAFNRYASPAYVALSGNLLGKLYQALIKEAPHGIHS